MTYPFENDTGAARTMLVRRSLQNEKRRNIMIILAVALAAFLMSMCGNALLTGIKSQTTMAEDTFEVLFQEMTTEKNRELKQFPEIERIGLTYNLGSWKTGEGDEISYSYMNDEAMYTARRQLRLAEGRMPASDKEIAVEKGYLDKYAPGGGTGSKIMLPTDGGQTEFVVTGIFVSLGQSTQGYSCLVSEEFIRSSPLWQPDGYTAYVHFRNADNLPKEELKKLGAGIGSKIGADFAYSYLYFNENKNVSAGNVSLFLCLVLLIVFSGGIVIQSIFRISVNEKIRSYGQLRTLGATSGQIKGIVREESRRLAFMGIPTGVVPGSILGTVLGSNKIADGFDFANLCVATLFTVLISGIMVELSIRRPVQIAARVSPMEAVRFMPGQAAAGKSHTVRRKASPFRMACANLGRDKTKAVSTLLSLSLGGLLLFIMASFAVSYSAENFTREKIFLNGGDFRVYLDSGRMSTSQQLQDGSPLNQELMAAILSIDGVKQVLPVRDSAGESRFRIGEYYLDAGLCDVLSTDGAAEGRMDYVAQHLTKGRMPENKYEILAGDLLERICPMSLIGQVMELTINGTTAEVTVTGYFDVSFVGTEDGFEASDGCQLMITEELARELSGGISEFSYAWEITTDPDRNNEIGEALEQLLAEGDAGVSMCSLREEADYLQGQMDLFIGGLGVLGLLIFLFGIIHLINMTLSNQYSRRQELAMMRSVGMTGRQVRRMLFEEGLLYLGGSLFVILLAGIPVSLYLCRTAAVFLGLSVMPYRFPVLPLVIYILFFLLLELALTAWSVRDMNKKPLVEQLLAE